MQARRRWWWCRGGSRPRTLSHICPVAPTFSLYCHHHPARWMTGRNCRILDLKYIRMQLQPLGMMKSAFLGLCKWSNYNSVGFWDVNLKPVGTLVAASWSHQTLHTDDPCTLQERFKTGSLLLKFNLWDFHEMSATNSIFGGLFGACRSTRIVDDVPSLVLAIHFNTMTVKCHNPFTL